MRAAMLLHKSVEFDSRVRREASALAAAGHEVTVVELAEVPQGAEALDGFARLSCLPPAWVRRRLPSPLYRAVMLVYFVAAVVRVRPDVIHAHDAAMLVPGLVGARLTGAQLVYDSHELASSVPYRERAWAWFVTAVERAIVPRCAAVITVSDGIAARLQERYGLPVTPTVVRNVSALEPGGTSGLRQRLGIDARAPLVLHQGAPAPDRGCEVLVEAVAQLEGVHLAFLGDPEPGYGEELSALIESRAIGARVSLLPSIPLRELLAWTAEADVGVTLLQDTCENHRLALPNKLFEYIAAGIPVVASALPEVQQLVDHYAVGWCVPPADASALAAALRVALAERSDADRRGRLVRAAGELSWEREQARLLKLYGSLQPVTSLPDPGPERDLVLLLVRNSVSNDARVLRAARTAERMARARVLVLGVAPPGTPTEEVLDGIHVKRLEPWRRFWRRRSSGAPRPGAPRELPPAPAAASSLPARLDLRTRLRRDIAGLSYAVKAVALARRLRPTVVHANDWNTMWAATAIKLVCGCRLIYDSHELWPERNGRWESRGWLLLSEALFVRVADVVTTTSPGHAQALAKRYRTKLPLVVRNIPEWATRGAPAPREPPVLLYIGGLMPGRGLEQMIAALPMLPHVSLRGVGPGAESYRASLLARAREAGVLDRVDLGEAVPPSQIAGQLDGAAIGVCLIQPINLSYELCLPNKLLEYIAGGLPVLASDLPVIAGVVSEYQLGEVVPPSDLEAIAAGVRRLLEPERRAAVLGGIRSFVLANPWSAESEILAGVYAGMLDRHAG